MGAHQASCDPAEVVHIQGELAKSPHDVGIGIIDKRTGQIRLFSYDETNVFSMANPQLNVSAGHEAAVAMAGMSTDHVRGFVLGKQGGDWHIFNQSHLNQADAQANSMRMADNLFTEIITALRAAGVHNPVTH